MQRAGRIAPLPQYPELPKMKKDLFRACQEGTWQDILDLLDKGASLGWCDYENKNALHYASSGNNYDVIQQMFSEKNAEFMMNINQRTKEREETPLLTACRLGHENLVELLFRYSSPPVVSFMRVSKLGSPLHVASLYGHRSLVKMLLDLRVEDIHIRDQFNDVPLHKAIQTNHEDIAKMLLGAGSLVNCRNMAEEKALHVAARYNCLTILDPVLQQPDVDVNEKKARGSTALHAACGNNNPEAVDRLLQHGADPTAVDDHKWTPLHVASSCGHVRIVRALLAKNADMDRLNWFNDTALSLATTEARTEVVRVLLDHGAQIRPGNARDPLKLAEGDRRRDIYKMLKDHLENQSARGERRPLSKAFIK